ncbi:MAG: tRNA (adenosine(37)-N6)-dimethylallyltransferase MiaA [Actinomycetota bacterium]|nr:tRNA (adenosine(37)-N6)-dimethylallyltransferase MiaA [Actinomycetota bacterium]MDD5667895.1 tRNA (adenosine(37)-N6)-dimethylallyltransferase MiaA [Actinomycetota bacterium]
MVAAILGPTATGKSRIALEIAPSLGAEIVSVDSMQVYSGMDIGTAKPDPGARRLVPHHMLDVVDAATDFSVAQFQRQARKAVEDILSRGRIALLVGGTGLYFEAVVNEVVFPPGSGDDDLRKRLQREFETDQHAFKERLARVDPAFAAGEGYANPRRVVRAMEVYERTGMPFSVFQDRREAQAPHYHHCGVVLDAPRQALYRAIEKRVDEMFESGLVHEVRELAQGSGLSRTARQGLGYKEVLAYLDSGISLEDTINNIKRRSRNYAKRQLTWFRRIPGLCWMELDEDDLSGPSPRIVGEIRDYLRGELRDGGRAGRQGLGTPPGGSGRMI